MPTPKPTKHTAPKPAPIRPQPNCKPAELTHKCHLTLNHAPRRALQQMAKHKTIDIIPTQLQQPLPAITCQPCRHAKLTKAPHEPNKKTYAVGSYTSTDTCGPITPTSKHGNNHFLNFIEAQSRFLTVYSLIRRDQVSWFTNIHMAVINTLNGAPPHTVRADSAKEFTTNNLIKLHQLNGTTLKTRTPYQPQENSRAERIILTLMNPTRAALQTANLPDDFWEDALTDATYKYNRMLLSTTGKPPAELWFHNKPKPTQMFIFRVLWHVPVHKPKGKLDSRATIARYMTAIDDTVIRVWLPVTDKYIQVRAVDFRPYNPHKDPSCTTTTALQTTRTRPPDPPQSTKHARTYPETKQWEDAHDTELATLDKARTFRWIHKSRVPKSAKVTPLQMTYRYKHSPTLDIDRKARSSVRGDRMQPYLHYDPNHTASYMAEKTTIRTLLAIAARC